MYEREKSAKNWGARKKSAKNQGARERESVNVKAQYLRPKKEHESASAKPEKKRVPALYPTSDIDISYSDIRTKYVGLNPLIPI